MVLRLFECSQIPCKLSFWSHATIGPEADKVAIAKYDLTDYGPQICLVKWAMIRVLGPEILGNDYVNQFWKIVSGRLSCYMSSIKRIATRMCLSSKSHMY